MKNSTTTTVILKAIDLELKSLLKKDLENFRMKHTKQAPIKKAA